MQHKRFKMHSIEPFYTFIFMPSNFYVHEAIEELQNDNIDIWHISSNTVELCTSISDVELNKHYNLHHCRVIETLKDLVKLEEYSLLRFV